MNFADPDELFDALFKARVNFLNNIASSSVAAYERRIVRNATEKEKLKHTKKRFIKGWLNRLNDLKNLK